MSLNNKDLSISLNNRGLIISLNNRGLITLSVVITFPKLSFQSCIYISDVLLAIKSFYSTLIFERRYCKMLLCVTGKLIFQPNKNISPYPPLNCHLRY